MFTPKPKKIISFMLALIVIFSAFPLSALASSSSDTDSSYVVKVTGSAVNIRSGAGTNYSKIGSVKKNATYEYLGSAKDSLGRTWYKIQYTSSKTGWITSQYSKLVAKTASTATTVSVYKVKITGSSVNVRKRAGTSYGRIGTAKKNQTFTYLGKKTISGKTWYKIQYTSTKTGWVSGTYSKLVKVTVSTTASSTTTTTAVPTLTTTTNASDVVSDTNLTASPTSASTTVTTTTTTVATTTTTTASTSINPSYNYTLSKGSTGTKVKAMQTRLKALGYIAEAPDGDYGNNTVRSVKAFQKIAGLEITGVADPITLTVLYSSSAPNAPATYNHADVYNPDYEKNYYIIVYQKNNRVLVLGKDDYGKYNQVIKCFTCSVGVDSKTPNGLFTISNRYSWRLLFGNVYGQYAVRFYGNYLFHSVPYTKQSASTLQMAEYNKLGEPASKGCVRLCVRDAKWIYDNAVNGTQVRVLSGKNCTETPEPIPELNTASKYKGWDPTDPNTNNPYNA